MSTSFLSYSGTLMAGTALLAPLLTSPLRIHVGRHLLINPKRRYSILALVANKYLTPFLSSIELKWSVVE